MSSYVRQRYLTDLPVERIHHGACRLARLSIFGALKTSAHGLQLLFEAFAEGKKWVSLRKILCR